MNKKLLLRRPRLENHSIEYEHNNDHSDEGSKCTNFRNQLQNEMDEIDREILLELETIKNDSIDKFEQQLSNVASDLKQDSLLESKLNVISCNNLSDGLIPIKNIKKKSIDRATTSCFSAKTVQQFEKIDKVYEQTQKSVNFQDLFQQIKSSIPVPNRSIPRHIIIIQMAALLKFQLSNSTEKLHNCAIRKLPKIPGKYFPTQSAPKYEIVLYENNDVLDLKSIKPCQISDILQEDLMNVDWEDRSAVFVGENSTDVSPVQVSMMECQLTGRIHLNLEAHSISEIPDISESFPNLTVLNLSYNSFKNIPDCIFQLQNLEVLNIKNNPIQSLDKSIVNLSKLRVLIASYTYLSALPSCILNCSSLEELDLSYNELIFFPNADSSNRLKLLNLSGNPICYFKKSFLKLQLACLSLIDTWIHPAFWREGFFDVNISEKTWMECDLCGQCLQDTSLNRLVFCRKFDHVIPILLSFCSSICRDSYS